MSWAALNEYVYDLVVLSSHSLVYDSCGSCPDAIILYLPLCIIIIVQNYNE